MLRIEEPVSPRLEMAAIQRRVFAADGPALLFTNTGTFPMVSNLYGSMERIEYIFRDAIEPLRRAIAWGADPLRTLSSIARPGRPDLGMIASSFSLFRTVWCARPKVSIGHAARRRAPVFACETTLDQLPQLISWPDDGGAFITLPQVYTEPPEEKGNTSQIMRSNLGMYRVQISGNNYQPNIEAGLHYQIRRGIAAHHQAARNRGEPLRVNIFIGGAPAMTLAAIMPLPEGVSELAFAGMLGRHRIPMAIPHPGTLPVYAEADFCISGYLDTEQLKREGPFGDHLGYYSLAHEFPLLHIEYVRHRQGAIWPFTVVGRPPQEDSMFGRFIHELIGEAVPQKIPGLAALRAVDEAGVHPLCLAIGREEYVPNQTRRSAQLHALAHTIFGFGQLALAKYLFLVSAEDDPLLDINDTLRFFIHLLRRVDWSRDLHFVTETTADTLDYSAAPSVRNGELNHGSKLLVAACGSPVRELGGEINAADHEEIMNTGCFQNPRLALPGVLLLEPNTAGIAGKWTIAISKRGSLFLREKFPLWVVVDDSAFASESTANFLWTTFTKSDPATDVHGFGAFTNCKHWGCTGPLVIDATRKPHHAPELSEDPEIAAQAEEKTRRILERWHG